MDNGSEFLNPHLLALCENQHITLTRSRAYPKNDGCYVEQKNWTVVRRYVGYLRYEGNEQVALLNTSIRCCACTPTSCSHGKKPWSKNAAGPAPIALSPGNGALSKTCNFEATNPLSSTVIFEGRLNDQR